MLYIFLLIWNWMPAHKLSRMHSISNGTCFHYIYLRWVFGVHVSRLGDHIHPTLECFQFSSTQRWNVAQFVLGTWIRLYITHFLVPHCLSLQTKCFPVYSREEDNKKIKTVVIIMATSTHTHISTIKMLQYIWRQPYENSFRFVDIALREPRCHSTLIK